jgi:filamentous hemagglutinin family protein
VKLQGRCRASKKALRNRIWQFGLARLLGAIGAIGILPTPTCAQVIADPSVGTTVTSNGAIYLITGGTTVGSRNLFHSFDRFDVPLARTAAFINTPNIANIFARVTGGTPSNIQGLIYAQGIANLFLINPSGILFGSGAQLNIGGSFVATTANAIEFPGGAVFSLTSPVDPQNPLLTVNPSAFLFNQITAAPIQISSRAFAGRDPSNSFNVFGLRVPDGKSLLLLGGDVNTDGGRLVAFGGRIDIGGVAGTGRVGLSVAGSDLRLSFPESITRADILHQNNARLVVAAGGGGSIALTARNIRILSGSSIEAGILAGLGTIGTQAGDINLNATGEVKIEQFSRIKNDVNSRATGNGGNIDIKSNSILMTGNAQLSTSSFGNGDAGNILMQIAESAVFRGDDTFVVSNVSSRNAIGNAGNIRLNAGSVYVTEGAQLNSFTRGRGNAGNVTIQADGAVLFDGVGKSDRFPSAANINVEAGAVGDGGSINITAGALSLTNGGQLSAIVRQSSTALPGGRGNGGTVNISVRDAVTISGKSADGTQSGIFSSLGFGAVGSGGDINITARSFSITDAAQLSVSTSGRGDAGNILMQIAESAVFRGDDTFVISNVSRRDARGNAGNIRLNAGSVYVTEGAQLNSFTRGRGNAGNVTIQADGAVLFDGVGKSDRFSSSANINVEAGAVGGGGSINITAGALSLMNGGQLSAIVRGPSTALPGGRGNGGTVNINVRDAVTISGKSADGNRSGIFSSLGFGAVGSGGDINITANSLSILDGAELEASSFGRGVAGDILIRIHDAFQAKDGTIASTSTRSSGGNINVTARTIRLRGDSDVTTNIFSGTGSGGNITLTAESIIALDDSDILAFAQNGRGGNIILNTPAFFGQNYYPAPPDTDPRTLDGNNRVDINASGRVSGIVILPDLSFLQNSLTEFPQTLINTSNLLANSCIVRNQQQNGSFFITGSGGLPEHPGNASISAFPTGEVRSVQASGVGRLEDSGAGEHGDAETQNSIQNSSTPHTSRLTPSETRPWKIGDPIAEPQGVYQLPNGELVMSRDCGE